MSIVNRHLSIVNLHFTEILDRTTTYESVAPTCDHCLSYGSQQVPSSFVKSLIMVSRSCSLSMSGLSSSLADAKPLAVVSRVVPAASQYQVKSSHSPTPQTLAVASRSYSLSMSELSPVTRREVIVNVGRSSSMSGGCRQVVVNVGRSSSMSGGCREVVVVDGRSSS